VSPKYLCGRSFVQLRGISGGRRQTGVQCTMVAIWRVWISVTGSTMAGRSTQYAQRCSLGKHCMAGCFKVFVLFLLGSFVAACGGDAPTSPSRQSEREGQVSQPPNQIIVLRGGERMAWDQRANSLQVARSYSYRLFVDGLQSALSDIRCSDTGGPAGYECSGLLPPMQVGQHTLEVAAVIGNLQSSSSAPIVVRVTG
jgi:hypothetical protein